MKATFGVRWAQNPLNPVIEDHADSSMDLIESWRTLARLSLERYKDFQMLENYMALIERKITDSLNGQLESDSCLMDYANQLEDVFFAMDIEASLQRATDNETIESGPD